MKLHITLLFFLTAAVLIAESVYRTGSLALLSGVLMLFIGSICFVFYLRSMYRSLKLLSEYARKFTELDPVQENAAIDLPAELYADNEIGTLADSLVQMRKAAHAKMRALTEAHEELQREILILRESEVNFRRLAENAKDMIYCMSLPDGRYQYVSPAAIEVFGYPPDTFYANPTFIREVIHPAWRQYFTIQWQRLLNGDMPSYYEYQIIDSAGRERWVNQRNKLIRDPTGTPVAIEGVVTDITERKQAENALQESNERYHALFERSLELVYINDFDGNFLDANPAALHCLGYSYEEIRALNFAALLPPDQLPIAFEMTKRLLETGTQDEAIQYTLRRKNGESVCVETVGSVIYHEKQPVAIQGIARDITARKQTEDRVRQLNAKLEQQVIQHAADLEIANRELKEFAYVVSHDLKTPLRGISRLTNWLVEDYANAFDDRGRKLADMLIGRVQRLDHLIDGILEYSRIGRVPEKPVTLDLDHLAREVVRNLAPPGHINIVIETTLPIFTGDLTYLRQVFEHLIRNAITFMDKPRGEIRVGCRAEGDSLTFWVTDNGPGIEKKYHSKIFHIFQTLQTRDDYESTGVGLTVVKKIVEFYGGTIWVESTKGQGSTFFFTLSGKRRHAVENSPCDKSGDSNNA